MISNRIDCQSVTSKINLKVSMKYLDVPFVLTPPFVYSVCMVDEIYVNRLT